MIAEKTPPNRTPASVQKRRDFFSNLFMGTSLVVSHLTAGAFVLRYLYPVRKIRKQKLFIGLKAQMPPGSATVFKTPQGKSINIINGTDGFIALSDVCPHLGCRVHWDSMAKEFICPCHNGHFDASGAPISGPPAEMGAALSTFKVVLDDTSVYIDLEVIA